MDPQSNAPRSQARPWPFETARFAQLNACGNPHIYDGEAPRESTEPKRVGVAPHLFKACPPSGTCEPGLTDVLDHAVAVMRDRRCSEGLASPDQHLRLFLQGLHWVALSRP